MIHQNLNKNEKFSEFLVEKNFFSKKNFLKKKTFYQKLLVEISAHKGHSRGSEKISDSFFITPNISIYPTLIIFVNFK